MAISLAPGATLSDAQVQAQNLLHRQQIVDALIKNGLTSGSPTVDAGVLKVMNFQDPIKQLAGAFFGSRGQSGIDTDRADLAKQTQAIQDKGINDYFNMRSGSVDNNQAGPPDATGLGPAPRVTPPDRLGAVKAALSSRDPLLTQIGLSDLQSMNKGALTPSDIAAHMSEMTPESQRLFLQTGDPSVLKPMAKTTTVNGQVVPQGQTGDYRDKFGPVGPIPGAPNVTGQTNTATGEAKFAPAGTNVNLNTGPKMTQAAFEGANKQVQESFGQFQKNQQNLGNIATAQDALKTISDARMGPLSQYQQIAAQLGAKFGFQVPQAANREQLDSALAQNLGNVIRLFAPVSDKDMAEAQKMAGSGDFNTKAGLAGLLNRMATDIGRQMDQHQKLVNNTAQWLPEEERQRYIDTFNPAFTATSGFMQAPQATEAAGGQPASTPGASLSPDVEALLKKYGQ